MRRYVFVDEAGNFDFSSRGSRYFVLTSISMETCRVGHDLLDLRRELAWDRQGLLPEFHASEESQAVRDRVFALIARHQFRIDSTIIEKCKASPRLTRSDIAFYTFAWRVHAMRALPQVVPEGDDVLIVSSAIGTRRKQSTFKESVLDVMRRSKWHADARVEAWSAASDPCLQVADYCCWAIQRKWELGDERSYIYIADKIGTEFDVFRRGNLRYY
jgi:hypothetical protein